MKQLLLIKTIINTQDIYRDILLSNAACNGHSAIVEVLLEAGAENIGPEPGPCCDSQELNKPVEGNARNALLRAWEKGL